MGYLIPDNSTFTSGKTMSLNGQPGFSCLILYKRNHVQFSNYINRNFDILDKLSGEHINFYVFDQGLFNGVPNNFEDTFDQNVDIACEVFGIHPSRLPAVLIFPDLDSRSCNSFFFQDESRVLTQVLNIFFQELFGGAYLRGNFLNKMKMLISATSHLRNTLPNVPSQICYLGDNINGSFEQIRELIISNHREVMNGIHTIVNKLEEIQQEFKPRKMIMTEQLQELLALPDSPIKVNDVEELRKYIDEQLCKNTERIEEAYGAEAMPVSLAKYGYLSCFEETSIQMIKSCIFADSLETEQHVDDFDYSLCAAGYWKAIEIELNIIIVDTIRKLKNIIDYIPNDGNSNGNNQVWVDARRGGYQPYRVNINKKNKNILKSCMFGDMLNIAENYPNNEFKIIINSLFEENEYYTDLSEFMAQFITEIRDIVNIYRNEYSHTGVLTEARLAELKSRLFSDDGAYSKIAILKRKLNDGALTALPISM